MTETFPTIIRNLRERKNYTQTELAELLGMKTYTTITKWEAGENFPKGKDIKRLAEIFNVSSDYLLGLDGNENSLILHQISDILQQLDKSRQGSVYNFAKYHLKEQQEGKEFKKVEMDTFKVEEKTQKYDTSRKGIDRNSRITYLPEIIEGLFSAGSGIWQDDDLNIEVWIPEDAVPKDFDSIAKVVGNSMLPRLRDEDLLFVKFDKPVELNQIGLFKVNGTGNYVKKLRQHSNGVYYLESLNPDYDNIEFKEGDEVITIGAIVGEYRK